MAVEARTLKYDVFANFEAIVKFGDHRVEFFPVVLIGDVSRCQDVLCCLSHTVEQHGQLLHVSLCGEARCFVELLEVSCPAGPIVWGLKVEGYFGL